MINNRWVPFADYLTWISPAFPFLILVTAFVELITAAFFWMTPAKDYSTRLFYAHILACMLIFDAVVAHCPFTELERNYGKEVNHFSSDLALLGGLYMLAGYREDF